MVIIKKREIRGWEMRRDLKGAEAEALPPE